jgi:enoyl-CoA hydratase/carnithine racemase
MMTDETFGDVTVTATGPIAMLVFSRPPSNFFDIALIRSIGDALEHVDAQPELRAVVLASEGKSFCAGANFGGGKGGGSGPGTLYAEALRIFATRKPIVAAVQGAAIGGGMGLAMAADFRVVSPETRLAANFVKIGIHPGFGLTHTLPRAVGPQIAASLFYSGRRIDGAEAVRLGVADILTAEESVRDRALTTAREIAENAPLAVEATRQTLRAGLVEAIRRQTDIEAQEQSVLFATADFREGVQSVNERRPGRWVRA